jgi:ribosomal protein S18 acetylase RimI-like enzyme
VQHPKQPWTPVARGVKTFRELTTTNTAFRFACLDDAPSIVALVESAYRGDSSRVGWTTEADILGGQRTDMDEVTAIINSASARLLLAHCNEQLTGCVLVRDENSSAYIGMLAIRPDYQAHGLGRKLLGRAEQYAYETWGATVARMTVIIQREELIRYYERRGYCRTKHREPFPYGDPRFGLPKRPDLEFIVLEKQLSSNTGIRAVPNCGTDAGRQ